MRSKISKTLISCCRIISCHCGGRISRDIPGIRHRRAAGTCVAWRTSGTQSSAEEPTNWQSDVRCAYRIEVEELKRQAAGHKCGKKGHWARERRSSPTKGHGKGNESQAASSDNASTGAALAEVVPSCVAAVGPLPSLLDQVRLRCSLKTSDSVMRKRSIWYQALALAYWTLDVARQSLDLLHWLSLRNCAASVAWRAPIGSTRRTSSVSAMEKLRPVTLG